MGYTFWLLVVWWNWLNVLLLGWIALQWLTWVALEKLMSFVGFSGMRTRNHECQTAIITYEHPVTRRRVVCVGMIHITEPQYFQALQKLIDELQEQGYAILYEFIVPPTEEEFAGLDEREKNLVRTMPKVRDGMQSQAALLDLVYQKYALTYPPSWTRTDMGGVEFVRALSHLVDNTTLLDPPQEYAEAYRQLAKIQLNGMFKTFPLWCMLLNLIPLRGLPQQLRDLFIVRRNEIAVRGIRTYLDQGNVVTMWGAGHLWGIGNHLRRDGFREIDRQWITAYHIRHFGWWKSKRLSAYIYWNLLKKLWSPA